MAPFCQAKKKEDKNDKSNEEAAKASGRGRDLGNRVYQMEILGFGGRYCRGAINLQDVPIQLYNFKL